MAQDIPSDPVTRLNRLDCCAVSDAMDKLGLKGSVSGLDQRASTRRIAGRIVTFKLVKAADGRLYKAKSGGRNKTCAE